jgi:2-hydroxy-3-keto-5-methylthiopentenyl-1-phosphate phosphatase
MTKDCSAGTCKCMVAKKLAKGLPIILIGDGRSDFCLADKADYVLAKGGLATYCEKHRIPFTAINNFNDAIKCLQTCDIHYYTSLCKDHSQDE